MPTFDFNMKKVNPFKLPMRTNDISFDQVHKMLFQALLEFQFISNYLIATLFRVKIRSSQEQLLPCCNDADFWMYQCY